MWAEEVPLVLALVPELALEVVSLALASEVVSLALAPESVMDLLGMWG